MLAQIMPPVETVCSFKEGSSNVDSKCTLEELSYSLRSCEPFPVSDIDPSMSSIAQDISSSEVLAGAFNSISIVETTGQIDDDGNHNVRFDDPVEMKLHDVICSSSPRRSARVTKLIQKNQTRLAAKRCRKNVVKNEMLDSILLRVARKTRSYGCRPARSSVWGSVGITQVFENTASQVTKNRSTKSRKCRRVRGSGKGKNDQAVTGLQMSNGKTSASFGRIRLKVKLGKEMSQACLTDMVSVTENDLPDFRANGTEVHRVTNFSGHMLNDVLGVKGTHMEKVVTLPKSIDICPGDMDLQSPVTCEKSDEFVADSHQEVPSPIEIEESGVAVDNKYLDLGTSPDSEVINLIPEAQVIGKDKSVFHDVQISSETFVAPVDIPSLKLPPKSTKKGKKSERMPHAGNFNVQDRFDSLEILNRAGVVEKCGQEEGLGDGFHFSEASISTTTANVSENPSSSERFSGELLPSSRAADMGGMFPCVKSKEQKHLKNSRSNRMSKSGSELSDSPRSQRGNACRQKGNSVKSVSGRKVKDKAACDEVVCKVENYQERGHNSSDGFRKDKTGDGNLVREIFNTDMAHRGAGDQSLLPRNAWVRCDECLKWRRIPATLADSIDETNCRWTCKDNVAKGFADCSIPQEKSNAEINAELEISDASCEEDACYGRVSSKRSHPNPSADRQQSSWMLIKSNMFLHRSRKSQTIDEIMVCHCKRPTDGRMGCGDGCLNRMLNIECVQGTCPCGERCSNQQFQKRKYAKLRWFRCGKKGYGLQLLEDISEGQFLIEYTGEVLDMQAYEARQREYASKGHKHFYFMTLNGSEVIDACAKGNLGRFINHSCDPNCRTEKWMVNGEVCIGLFALKDLKKGDEVTFDYNYVRVFGAAAKKCVCGSSHCRGYIGGDPRNSEVIVQGDSDEEFPEPLMVYDDGEIDDSLKKLISATSPLDDIQTSITDSEQVLGNKDKLEWTETDESANDIHHLEISPGKLGSKSALSEKPEISFEVVENSVEVLQPSVQKVKTSLQLDNASGDTISDSERVILLSPEASALAVADKKSLSDSSDTKKKYKSDISEDRLASKSSNLMKTTRLSSSVKKGKSRSSSNNSGNVSKLETMVNKSHGPPYKPKKIIEGSLDGRFEAVEEKLNELLDVDGGISKRKDATKGYLKLLLLTAASGDSGNGEVIQSNRDLSMILDALLKTKSRFVLVDIISKNGLQMLHNIMKRYRRDFSKIPILRKLLKVLEFLAAREILTLEHITRGPPCLGVESFRESILTLTEHDDKQVHQIARNFRDKWIPRPARKSTDFHRGINCNRYSVSHNHWREKSLQTTDGINCNKQSVAATATVSVDAGMQEGCSSSCSSVCQISETRTRKRKSRWDQPANTNADSGSIQTKEPHIQPGFLQSPCSSSQPESVTLAFNHMQRTNKEMPPEKSVDGGENMDEDVPPGFAPLNAPSNDGENSFSPNCPCKVEIGRPQGRFMNRLAVSYGIPLPVVQQLGNLKTENLEDWVIAPGVPFHPFPPLPPYPRNLSEDRTDNRANLHPAICHSDKNTPSTSVYIPSDKEIEGTKHRFQEARGSHSLGRRYFRQQKWNNSKLPPPSVRNRNGWGGCLGNDSRNGMCSSIGGPNGSEADGNMNNACTSFPQNPQLEKFH